MNYIPKVSVVMLVYNREKYLKEAIECILNQTFKDFELIIIDDGSKDNSVKIIESYTDPRIRLIKNIENRGIPASRNIGIEESKGEYIMNFDSDDVCDTKTIEKQLNFLECNFDYGVCGCWYKMNGIKKITYPIINDEIKAAFLFNSYVSNSALMIKKSLLKEFNIKYDCHYTASEDYDFFSRLLDKTKFYNIPEFLTNYRQHETQSTNTLSKEMKNMANEVRKNLLKKINIELSDDDFNIFQEFSNKKIDIKNKENEKTLYSILELIIENNQKNSYFSEDGLKKIIANHLFIIYGKNFNILKGIIKFFISPIGLKYKIITFLSMLKRI